MLAVKQENICMTYECVREILYMGHDDRVVTWSVLRHAHRKIKNKKHTVVDSSCTTAAQNTKPLDGIN